MDLLNKLIVPIQTPRVCLGGGNTYSNFKLPALQPAPQGTDCTFADSANVLRTNIEQIYGGFPSLDKCPLAEGEITDIADGTMFIGLQRYQQQ
jgi:hypothetical protein